MWTLNCLLPIGFMMCVLWVISVADAPEMPKRVSGKRFMDGKRNSYPTDLTDAEWEMVKPLIAPEKLGGYPWNSHSREIINAIFYRMCLGCLWDMLPHDFPPCKIVCGYFNKWSKDGTWEQITMLVAREIRFTEGHDLETGIDSQSGGPAERVA
jgi:putative transposase